MSYYQNLGLQYLPDGCRPCASVKAGDLVQTKFVFQGPEHAMVFWFDILRTAPDFYVANTAANACCIAANDLGVTLAGYDLDTFRAVLNKHAATCTADTPYKLKEQP